MVAFFTEVPSLEECQELCSDMTSCRYISYFGDNIEMDTDDPVYYDGTDNLAGFCALFSRCSVTRQCRPQACITLDTSCTLTRSTCSTQVVGQIGDNLVAVHKVDQETQCQQLCQAEGLCNFYSYYTMKDLYYPGTCFLLTSLKEPINHSYDDIRADFVTGTKNCYSGCQLISAESVTTDTALLMNSTGTTKDVVVVGDCELTLVAVGQGAAQGSNGNGGGSGYVEYLTLNVDGGLLLRIRWSSVSVPMKWNIWGKLGGTTLEARSAPDGSSDGYSGGGGPGGDGGQDGGDGQPGSHHPGGSGSGVKVSEIPLNAYVLRQGQKLKPFRIIISH